MKTLFTALVILGFATDAFAVAGTEGHGGGAMVCRLRERQITGVYLLDLWEAEMLWKQELIRSTDSVDAQIAVAMLKLANFDPELFARAQKLLPIVQEAKVALGSGVSISPPSDAKNSFFKTDCSLEGVALYDDEQDRLYINETLYEQMYRSDQAALIMHEVIYKALREMKSPYSADSRYARKIVGFLFAKDYQDPKAGVPETARFCKTWNRENEASRYEFYLYGADGALTLQFTKIDGLPVFGKTAARVENLLLGKIARGEQVVFSWDEIVNGAIRNNSSRIVARSGFYQKAFNLVPGIDPVEGTNLQKLKLFFSLEETRNPNSETDITKWAFDCK